MAGGRTNVESGLQTGMDVIATMALWDRNSTVDNSGEDITTTHGDEAGYSGFAALGMLIIAIGFIVMIWRQEKEIFLKD